MTLELDQLATSFRIPNGGKVCGLIGNDTPTDHDKAAGADNLAPIGRERGGRRLPWDPEKFQSRARINSIVFAIGLSGPAGETETKQGTSDCVK